MLDLLESARARRAGSVRSRGPPVHRRLRLARRRPGQPRRRARGRRARGRRRAAAAGARRARDALRAPRRGRPRAARGGDRHPRRARSIWVDTDGQVRRRLLGGALDLLVRFRPARRSRPIRAFAVTSTRPTARPSAMARPAPAPLRRGPRGLREGRRPAQRHRDRRRVASGAPDPGLDRRVARHRRGTRASRTPRGRAAVRHWRATRLLQAAVLVAWAVWRAHGADPSAPRLAGAPRRTVDVAGAPPGRAQVESRARSPAGPRPRRPRGIFR